jgi:hypothetical protein
LNLKEMCNIVGLTAHYVNRKLIKKPHTNGEKINCRWSINPRPFLQNKVYEFLKCDAKKIKNGDSEYDGKLSPYIIALVTADLKSRNIL